MGKSYSTRSVLKRSAKAQTVSAKAKKSGVSANQIKNGQNTARWSKDYNASRDPNVQRSKATPYSRNKAAKGSNTSYDVERIAMAGKDAGLSKGRINRRIKQYLANQNAGVKAARDTAVTLGSEAAGAYTSQAAAGAASTAYSNTNSNNKSNEETNSKIDSINDQLKKLEETMYGSNSGTQSQQKSTTDKNGVTNYESNLGAR